MPKPDDIESFLRQVQPISRTNTATTDDDLVHLLRRVRPPAVPTLTNSVVTDPRSWWLEMAAGITIAASLIFAIAVQSDRPNPNQTLNDAHQSYHLPETPTARPEAAQLVYSLPEQKSGLNLLTYRLKGITP